MLLHLQRNERVTYMVGQPNDIVQKRRWIERREHEENSNLHSFVLLCVLAVQQYE